MRRLEQDDGNGVVEDRLAKDDGIQFRFDLVEVEDGQDSDRVCCGKRCANRYRLDEAEIQAVQGDPRPKEQENAEDDGGDECATESESKDSSDVAEEVSLYWRRYKSAFSPAQLGSGAPDLV